jgi:putative transposase
VGLAGGRSGLLQALGIIKSRFTQSWLAAGGKDDATSTSRARHRVRGIWEKRFWEHKIRDQTDFTRPVHYIHFNPVKHRLVQCPHQWPYSSFARWVKEGYYTPDWMCDCAHHGIQVPDELRQGEIFGE